MLSEVSQYTFYYLFKKLTQFFSGRLDKKYLFTTWYVPNFFYHTSTPAHLPRTLKYHMVAPSAQQFLNVRMPVADVGLD